MRNLVILGAGTAGTLVANRLVDRLPRNWVLTVVDPAPDHTYQPDLVLVPLGLQPAGRMQRPREKTFASGVRWLTQEVLAVEPEQRRVVLSNRERLDYDLLVIASGALPQPGAVPVRRGNGLQRVIHHFYGFGAANNLRQVLSNWLGGRLVVVVAGLPVKGPGAPLEFLLLAHDQFERWGIRDRVELIYATPLGSPFAEPVAASVFGSLLEERRICCYTGFELVEIDAERELLRAADGRELGFELAVSIPLHGGAPFVARSGLGDDRGFVPTEPGTLLARGHNRIFAVGDANDREVPKTASMAHFEGELAVENVLRAIGGRSLVANADGRASGFVESGGGKALLVGFDSATPPAAGRFPVPWLGPFHFLKESRRNHWGKRAARWLYWNALLPGKPLRVAVHWPGPRSRAPAEGRPDALERPRTAGGGRDDRTTAD